MKQKVNSSLGIFVPNDATGQSGLRNTRGIQDGHELLAPVSGKMENAALHGLGARGDLCQAPRYKHVSTTIHTAE